MRSRAPGRQRGPSRRAAGAAVPHRIGGIDEQRGTGRRRPLGRPAERGDPDDRHAERGERRHVVARAAAARPRRLACGHGRLGRSWVDEHADRHHERRQPPSEDRRGAASRHGDSRPEDEAEGIAPSAAQRRRRSRVMPQIFRRTSAHPARPRPGAPARARRVGRRHQALADQKRAVAGAGSAPGRGAAEPALRHGDDLGRHPRRQRSHRPIDRERPQVPVVDADDSAPAPSATRAPRRRAPRPARPGRGPGAGVEPRELVERGGR